MRMVVDLDAVDADVAVAVVVVVVWCGLPETKYMKETAATAAALFPHQRNVHWTKSKQ